jgi:hypothetical protein
MKSSSESMLAVVDAGVSKNPFFRLTGLAVLGLEVSMWVASVLRARWKVAAFRCAWAAVRGSLSMAASAAVLFRVLGGVVNEAAKVPGMEVVTLRHTSLDKTCDEHGSWLEGEWGKEMELPGAPSVPYGGGRARVRAVEPKSHGR